MGGYEAWMGKRKLELTMGLFSLQQADLAHHSSLLIYRHLALSRAAIQAEDVGSLFFGNFGVLAHHYTRLKCIQSFSQRT
jgi:hypothetical protein